jgi:hypothetical protein
MKEAEQEKKDVIGVITNNTYKAMYISAENRFHLHCHLQNRSATHRSKAKKPTVFSLFGGGRVRSAFAKFFSAVCRP